MKCFVLKILAHLLDNSTFPIILFFFPRNFLKLTTTIYETFKKMLNVFIQFHRNLQFKRRSQLFPNSRFAFRLLFFISVTNSRLFFDVSKCMHRKKNGSTVYRFRHAAIIELICHGSRLSNAAIRARALAISHISDIKSATK